ncbi:hypothetical protein EII31_07245 [Leucobacter sp. OH2974_COT-288]|nr:hypothetical protein EII31_07245 [Leucobacter sp. OH2974_COT-288]
MLPSGGVFANGEAELSESAVGRVRCVDVSTLTVMSDNSPQAGDTVQVSTRVSNSFGIAENVPFRMKLSTEQKAGKTVNVLEPAVTDIVCEVETGDAVCPTGFAYDAATNTITATIPRLSQGSAVWIRVDGLLITATKYLKSYDLFAEAPNVFGDVNLGDAGTNRSSTTFRWTEVVTIPIPTITLAVLDDCGLDNAVWVKPEDDDMLRWELSDGGRRIVAYTNDGYVFTDGQKLHDYGLAPDSGTPCAGTQPPAPNPPGSGSGVVPVQPEKPHATIVAKDKMGKLPATGTEVPVAMTVLLCGICLGSLGAYLRFRKAA